MSRSTDESLLSKINRWVSGTPLRAVDQAYDAALSIKALEDKYFDGDSMEPASKYSENVAQYFKVRLRKQLQIIEIRLAEFRVSSTFSTLPEFELLTPSSTSNGYQESSRNGQGDLDSPLLKKLKFIDAVTSKYKAQRVPDPPAAEDPREAEAPSAPKLEISSPQMKPLRPIPPREIFNPQPGDKKQKKWVPTTTKVGIIPRSIVSTFNRLQREMKNYEDEVVSDYRESRVRTVASLKFLFLLAFLPLVFQVVTKNFIFTPLVDHFHSQQPTEIHLSLELEEEALQEFEHFKERLEFEHLLRGEADEPREESHRESRDEEKLREKVLEIASHYGKRSVEGIKNILADLVSMGVFAWLIFIGREEIQILKTFLDQIVYGLSDSAKAFIIILFTDVFVGFHSPHGWEVLLEGLSHHLGLPENRTLIFGFIATFPVFLDTLFKYWIFRYLSRVSPSAVATYKTMNE